MNNNIKHFIYFESQEGGMDEVLIEVKEGEDFPDLEFVYGWGNENCIERDEELKERANELEVGEFICHRKGTLVRIKYKLNNRLEFSDYLFCSKSLSY